MRKSSRAYVTVIMLALSIVLVSCGQGNRSDQAGVVGFDALIANPVQYAGQHVCTEGIHVDGFEASGLAAAMFEKGGHPQLTEPVIWVEGADLRSREDCIRTDTTPSFEFCQAMVCGVFETGARYGHGGAYAYQLRGQDMPAPAPSTLPTDAPRQGEAPLVEPPPAILAISGQEQVSGIGTYCWTKPTGEETALSLCADMAGIPTAEEPLVVSSPFTAAFRLAPEERPDELLLEVIPVTVEDEFEEWPAGWRGWAYKEGERHSLPLEREPSLELSLEPGLYVLNLMGWWEAWGDASYGFLVEVQPLLPGLSYVWPVSVNDSGTDFVLVAENAPNVTPLYVQVQDGGIEPWDADLNAFLPPAYVGDDLARVTFTGFPTLTYQVELDNGRLVRGEGRHLPLRHPVARGIVGNSAAHDSPFRRAAPLRIPRCYSADGRGGVRGYCELISPGRKVEPDAQF